MKRETAQHLASSLTVALQGARVERVWRPSADILTIKLGQVAERLVLCVTASVPHARLTAQWPANPANPGHVEIMLRTHLEGRRLARVDLLDGRLLAFTFSGRGETFELGLQLAGRYPNVSLLSSAGAELVTLKRDRPGRDAASPELADGTCPFVGEGFSEAYSSFTQGLIERSDLRARCQPLRQAVRQGLKRSRRALLAIEADHTRSLASERLREQGELLKSHLHQVKKGMTVIRLRDWVSGEEVEVVLDPRLSPVANLEKLFKRYRKYSGARELIAARKRSQIATVAAYTSLNDAISGADALTNPELAHALPPWEQALTALRGPRRSSGPSPNVKDKTPLPYREFKSDDGTSILLGRSAKHNDALTLRYARGHDVWLHARDCPGSHVVLRCGAKTEPRPDALLDAALLAAWHSKLRGEGVIDVMWTRKKYVTKPKGAPAGRVSVSASKTLSVRADPARLKRIYASEL